MKSCKDLILFGVLQYLFINLLLSYILISYSPTPGILLLLDLNLDSPVIKNFFEFNVFNLDVFKA